MNPAISPIFRTYEFHIGSFTIYPAIWQAIAIVFLLFMLVITMAQVRRHFMEWSFKGASFGVFLGFLLALILEGFLLVGGRTVLTDVLGWKTAPKPISNALDAGRSQLISVLGVSKEVPESSAAEPPTSENVIHLYSQLSPKEAQKTKFSICTP